MNKFPIFYTKTAYYYTKFPTISKEEENMNYKKLRIISTIGIFLLCFPLHFLYEWIPSDITAIFVPVNESIWEHMKLIFTGSILYFIIEYIFLYIKKEKIPNNYNLATFLSSLIAIPLYLIIFLPIYYHIGENMILSIGLLFCISIFISYLHYKITMLKRIPYQNIVAIICIILTYIVFGYLTYNPPTIDLFFDTKNEKYGMNIYNI